MNIQENIIRIKQMMGLIVEQETQGPTEESFKQLLTNNGFTNVTSQDQIDKIMGGPGKVNLSLADWYFLKKDEELWSAKMKEDGNIFFGRRTINVRNKDYFSKYGISKTTDVSMPTYSFTFPLEGQGKQNYDNAIDKYINNLDKKADLEKADVESIKNYISLITKDVPPVSELKKNKKESFIKIYNRNITTGINQSNEDISKIQDEKSKAELNTLLNNQKSTARNLGYTV